MKAASSVDDPWAINDSESTPFLLGAKCSSFLGPFLAPAPSTWWCDLRQVPQPIIADTSMILLLSRDSAASFIVTSPPSYSRLKILEAPHKSLKWSTFDYIQSRKCSVFIVRSELKSLPGTDVQ